MILQRQPPNTWRSSGLTLRASSRARPLKIASPLACESGPPNARTPMCASSIRAEEVSDAMTLAIAHTEGKTQILDLIRERKPPFSPEAVTEEFAKIIRSYRCTKVYGDRYGGEWPREQFRKHGVNYEPSEKPKSELYRDLLPLINAAPSICSNMIGW